MDKETKKRLIQLGVAVLPPIIAWIGLGFPTDRQALGILGAAIGGAVLAWLKGLEIAGKIFKLFRKRR